MREDKDGGVHNDIVQIIKKNLDENNLLVSWFRFAGERLRDDATIDLKLKLVCRRNSDGKRYNLPHVSEVAALIVGDVDDLSGNRDIIVESQSGRLKRNYLSVSKGDNFLLWFLML
ncbi:hypothetical protein OROMI_008503 [Orobanche minor]